MFLEKTRFFSTKPGFPGRTSVLLANPGYFKGLEAQGIYIYITYLLPIGTETETTHHPGSKGPGLLDAGNMEFLFREEFRICFYVGENSTWMLQEDRING